MYYDGSFILFVVEAFCFAAHAIGAGVNVLCLSLSLNNHTHHTTLSDVFRPALCKKVPHWLMILRLAMPIVSENLIIRKG